MVSALQQEGGWAISGCVLRLLYVQIFFFPSFFILILMSKQVRDQRQGDGGPVQ